VWLSEWVGPLSDSQNATKLELSFDHGLDTVVHVLDEVLLRATETASVGDVKDSVTRVRVLSVATADLHVKAVGNRLEARPVPRKFRQVDVDRSPQGSAQICGARSDVAQVAVVGELCDFLDLTGSPRQALEDASNVGSLLHRNDSQLIFLIDPDQESLVVVVEDAATVGPITVKATRLQEPVALPTQRHNTTIAHSKFTYLNKKWSLMS